MPNSPFLTVSDHGEMKNLVSMDFSAWGGFEGFLRDTSNGAGGYAQMNLLKRISPFLSQAIDMTAIAISTLPFNILNNKGDIVDSSKEWKNKIGFMENPTRFLYLIASSLCGGKAYCIPTRTPRMITDIRYIAPHTVLPLITTQGLMWFSRASDYGNAGVYSPVVPFPAIKRWDYKSDEEYKTAILDSYKNRSVPKVDKSKRKVDEATIELTIKNYYGDIKENNLKDILIEQNNMDNFTGEMVYFWLPDSDIEIGPAKKYPIGTALNAAQTCADFDNAVGLLARRNFVSPTLIFAKQFGNPKDRELAENWLNRFMKGAFDTWNKIIAGDNATALKVGANIDDMKQGLTEIKRQAIEEIGAAFGIPAAIFLSDKAFASETSPMFRKWYTSGVFVLIYQCIQETINKQMLNDYGYRWSFDLNALEAFQKDQGAMAAAFRDFASVRIRPSVAFQILGGKMPDGLDVKKLDEEFDKVETIAPINPLNNPGLPAAESLNLAANPKDVASTGGEVSNPKEIVSLNKTYTLNANEISDIALWKQAAKRWYPKGKSAMDWEPKHLSPEMTKMIRTRLMNASNELELIEAFEIDTTETKSSEAQAILTLADSLNKLAEKG